MNSHSVKFYNLSNISSYLPLNEEDKHIKNFLMAFTDKGAEHYVDNVKTEYGGLVIGDKLVPITINNSEYENSFVCSPYSHYISYALQTMGKIKNKSLKNLSCLSIKTLGKLMQWGKLNKVISVNNWLFTTNPSARLDKQMMQAIVDYLQQHFPDHAILFRSITEQTGKECYASLIATGFDLVASRFVWITDGKNEETFRTRIFKSDLKFMKESNFELLESHQLGESDIERIHELYHALYIRKYSQLNPQFNQDFIRLAMKQQLLHFKGVRIKDKLEGIVGFHCHNNVMISSFFGYDPDNQENKGVYRYLSTLLMQEAQKRKICFNQSAGGSFYKKIRRAKGEMEYTAIYHHHLPWKRRISWKFLKVLLNTVGASAMKKY